MSTNPKLDLLTPDNSTLVVIDYQPQMIFGVASQDRQLLMNNVRGLVEGARAFKIPTVLTTVETASFSGNMDPEILDIFPENTVFERTSMNTWEDQAVVDEVTRIGRKKLVFTALWTEVCLTFPVLEAIRDGYDVYFVTDSSGGTSVDAHNQAVARMIQAGATPLTWIQTVLEWQRDWARKDTYDAVISLMRNRGGAYGQGIEYAYTMVHGAPANRK